jgi:hypothetical protein
MKQKRVSGAWIFIFLVFLCLPSEGGAAITVSQDITQDTVWSAKKSPYRVTNNIKLQEDVSLKIEPGVVVEFYPEKSIEINGKLHAVGTAARPILFTASGDQPWEVISFTDFSDDALFSESGEFSGGCILSNCIIEKSGGVYVRFGAPLITQCEIRNNVSSGIRVEFGAPRIVANRIYANTTEPDPASGNGAGIIAYTDREVVIADNIIYNNISDGGRDGGGGIYAYAADNGKISITNNVVFGNTSSRFGGGIYAYNSSLSQNTVTHNSAVLRGGGIYAVECEVLDNLVQSNSAERGAGIFAENAHIKSNSILRNHARSAEGGGLHYFGSGVVEANCIAGNTASGEGACGGVYISGNPTVEGNNIIANSGYALSIANVADAPDVTASGNYWGTLSEQLVLDMTYDWLDHELAGLTIYKPFLKEDAAGAPPLPPFHLKAASRENGIELSWDEPAGANFTGHRIYVGSQSGYPYDTAIEAGPEKWRLITHLEPEKEYFVCVAGLSVCENAEKETGLSEEVRLYFSPSEETLAVPVNLSPADKSAGLERQVVLKASPPESGDVAVSYRWQVFAAGDSALTAAADVTTSGKTIGECPLDAGALRGGQEYFWRVASRSPTGSWSDWSKPTGFTTAADRSSALFGPISSTIKLLKDRSPYVITGNTIVMPGGALLVEPGVTVKFAPARNLKVRGVLAARGTEADPIVFTSESSDPWGSVIFADQSSDAVVDKERNYQDGSALEFCHIEKGKGVLIESSSPLIKNCDISDHGASGIIVRQGGPYIIGNDIHHNTAPTNGGGIYAYTNDIILVQANRIHDNKADGDGGGIYAYGYMNTSTIHVEDNDIRNNEATGAGGGVYLSRSSAVRNRIVANVAMAEGGGIYSTFGLVDENQVTDNQAAQGGGIFTEHNSSITGNLVDSNKALSCFGGGVYINFWGTSIENEVFVGNTVTANRGPSKNDNGGVYVIGYLVFEQNNIHDNLGSQLYNGNESDSAPLVAAQCYWGTSNGETIAGAIVDSEENPQLGKVTFEPFLAQPAEIK